MVEQTIQTLRELRLGAMAGEYVRQTELPQTLDLGFDERLALMCQAESERRADNRLKRLLNAATLSDAGASLDEIIYSGARGINKDLVLRLSNLKWVETPTNIIITGACGTGKSWLASAWAKHACLHGHSTRMLRLSRLLAELHLSRNDPHYLKLHDRLAKADLLILDDFGLERFDERACRDLLEIVEARYKRRATVFTAQLPVKKWHDLFSDKTIADAFLDRVVHNSYRFELKGPSMREVTGSTKKEI